MNPATQYSTANKSTPDEIIRQHADLVRRIAYHLSARVPDNVEVDDLIQVGMVGLLEAATKFDEDKGARFETFAGIRIRGAMLDEVRKHSWTPRSVHRKVRTLTEATRAIEARTGREARGEQIAAELGITTADYGQLLNEARGSQMFSLENLSADDNRSYEPAGSEQDDPLAVLLEEDLQSNMAKGIRTLPEREQLVMSLYYDDELNMREIGEVLGVSESRVCQIHGQALVRLRARMAEYTRNECGSTQYAHA